MTYCLWKLLPTAVAALFILCAPAMTQAAESYPACSTISERTTGLRLIPAKNSLGDLSITVIPSQKKNISVLGVSLLEGACVGEIYASRMGQVVFRDGEVFSENRDGSWVYSRNNRGVTLSSEHDFSHYLSTNQARLIMATRVDQDGMVGESATLNVGVFQTSDSYIVAAFIKRENLYTSPVELVRSAKPVKSVTFFPSPDSNGGSLWLLQNSESETSVITLGWDHSALSKLLRSDR